MSGLGLAIALGLRRLRAWHRTGWHKLTGRWPRYRWKVRYGRITCRRHKPPGEGWDGGRPCTSGEMKASLELVKSWQRKGNAAPEPDYSRRRL